MIMFQEANVSIIVINKEGGRPLGSERNLHAITASSRTRNCLSCYNSYVLIYVLLSFIASCGNERMVKGFSEDAATLDGCYSPKQKG